MMEYPRLAVELAPDAMSRELGRDAVVLPAEQLVDRAPDALEGPAGAAHGDTRLERGVGELHELAPFVVL